jgi:hypothetical protein
MTETDVQRLQDELAQAREQIADLTGYDPMKSALRRLQQQALNPLVDESFRQYEAELVTARAERDRALTVIRSLARYNGEAQEFLAAFDAAQEAKPDP